MVARQSQHLFHQCAGLYSTIGRGLRRYSSQHKRLLHLENSWRRWRHLGLQYPQLAIQVARLVQILEKGLRLRKTSLPLEAYSSMNLPSTKRESRLASALRSLVSHCQIGSTLQPRCFRESVTRLSRSRFALTFEAQYSTLDFGSCPFVQSWCPCQKHPCTKIASRSLERTISGRPGRFLTCSLYRKPELWRSLRTRSSGEESVEGTRDIM